MRVIEKQMCDAIREGRNWTNGNTQVKFVRAGHRVVTGAVYDVAQVFLHGHQVGQFVPSTGQLSVSLGGWNTPLVRSRINALCEAFAPGNWVHIRNGKPWFAGREISLDEWVQA